MNIEDIIQYTQKTPENVNPNMLRSMLSSLLKESTSDFTTCELTYINNAEDSYTLEVAYSYDNASFGNIRNDGFRSTETVNVILYKGEAMAYFMEGNVPSSSDISVTGAIEYDEESDTFTITGDGTITISD